MKKFLFAVAASICTAPLLSAAPGDGAFGGGFMDDIIAPYDDTAVELPGETGHKPSVSRSAQLVDDSAVDTWGTRDDDSASSSPSGQTSSSSSSSSSSSTSTSTPTKTSTESSRPSAGTSSSESSRRSEVTFSSGRSSDSRAADEDHVRPPYDLDENNPFKNNYKFRGRNAGPSQVEPPHPTNMDDVAQRIKDIMRDSVSHKETMLDNMNDFMYSPGRVAAREAPTTPDRWNRAPNNWFCDYDDIVSKAQISGKAIALFFHSSDNENSRKFKTERMESSKFKNKMRERLLVLYMDYNDNIEHHRDKRSKEQIEHDRRIAEKFHVSNYPMLIFLDSSGKEIGRISDLKTLNTFVEKADEIVPQKEREKTVGSFQLGGRRDSSQSNEPPSN